MIIGILGAILVLLGYFLATIKFNVTDPITFNLINFFGACFLMVNAMRCDAYVFVILNFVWAMIAVVNALKQTKISLERS